MTIYRNETPVVYAARFISAHNPFEQLMTMNDVAEGQLYASSRDVSRGEVRDTSLMKKMEEAQIKRNATVSLDTQWLCNDANLIPSPPFC